MKKKFFFDRKEKKLQMDSEENSFERCVLCGVVTVMYRCRCRSVNGNVIFREPDSCAETAAGNCMAAMISGLQQNPKSVKYRKIFVRGKRMYKKSPQGWLKHWDFILLDIFCLQLAFVVAYLVRQGLENPYSDQIYRTVAFVFMLCQIVVMFLGQSYQDILKRGYYIEFTKTAKHVLMVMLLSVLYLFATQQAVSYSRLTLFYTAFLYLCFDYVGRVWHKENVLKKNATKKKEKSMVVVVSLAEAKETIEKILSGPIQNFSINGLALIDDNPGVKEIAGIPVVGNMDTISEYLCHEWVDEVFVKISETEPYPQKLIDEIITMGLTVHLSLGEMEKSLSGKNFIEKIGGYSVITSSINTASPKQLLYKRLMDIAGGIVGCLLTVILIIVIGPMIYIKSPGPIFFSQVRIGKNGKKFKIYKFRSMYMDAEGKNVSVLLSY